jgi:hypothetical protein
MDLETNLNARQKVRDVDFFDGEDHSVGKTQFIRVHAAKKWDYASIIFYS